MVSFRVKEDMDVPTTTLIGAHGYCTQVGNIHSCLLYHQLPSVLQLYCSVCWQELVNLLLCGRAVSNVFDGDMELDSGNGNVTLLKGIKGQCEVGLLSLFEHYNICKVRHSAAVDLLIRTMKIWRKYYWGLIKKKKDNVMFDFVIPSGRSSHENPPLPHLGGVQWEPLQCALWPAEGAVDQSWQISGVWPLLLWWTGQSTGRDSSHSL